MRGMFGILLLRQISQVLAVLESNRVSGRNRDLDAGLGISADPPLAALDLKHAESTQLDAIAGAERRTHRLDDRFHGGGGLGPRDLGEVDHAIHDVGFDHSSSGVDRIILLPFSSGGWRRPGPPRWRSRAPAHTSGPPG